MKSGEINFFKSQNIVEFNVNILFLVSLTITLKTLVCKTLNIFNIYFVIIFCDNFIFYSYIIFFTLSLYCFGFRVNTYFFL